MELTHDALDQAEVAISSLPPLECLTEHAMALGFYLRKIHMPAGALLTTKTHARRHPFFITKGKVLLRSVDSSDCEGEILRAPYVGITEPGTRRLIYVEEPTEWLTLHALEEKDMEATIGAIESSLITARTNPAVNYANALNQPAPRLRDELEAVKE